MSENETENGFFDKMKKSQLEPEITLKGDRVVSVKIDGKPLNIREGAHTYEDVRIALKHLFEANLVFRIWTRESKIIYNTPPAAPPHIAPAKTDFVLPRTKDRASVLTLFINRLEEFMVQGKRVTLHKKEFDRMFSRQVALKKEGSKDGYIQAWNRYCTQARTLVLESPHWTMTGSYMKYCLRFNLAGYLESRRH